MEHGKKEALDKACSTFLKFRTNDMSF